MGGAEAGDKVKCLDLSLDGIDDLLLSVTDVHAPQSRHTIQNGCSVFKKVMDSFGLDEDARVLSEVDVVGEGHPVVVVGDVLAEGTKRLLLHVRWDTPEIDTSP